MLCLPVGSVREAASDADDLMGCYSVNFQLYDINGEHASLPLPLFCHIGIRNDIVNLFREFSGVWLHKDRGYKMKAQALFMLILHRIFELKVYKTDVSAIDPRIRKSIKYLTDRYSDSISVAMLAEAAGLRPVYFGALFKRETGVTVCRYLARVRISNAENLLRSGEYTVGEVSACCGYNDVHHFRKQFRAVKGYLPSQCIPERKI